MHASLTAFSLDVALKCNGLAVVTVERCPAADGHPVLAGYTLRVHSVEVVDFVAEGAADELRALQMAAEDVNASATHEADLVAWMVRAMRPRLQAALQGAHAVNLVLVEDQPMGRGWGGGGGAAAGPAAAAASARNLKTKCLQHALQAACLMLRPDARVCFANTRLKAQDFERLGRGKAADYGQRKRMSIDWTRRLLLHTMRVDGVDFPGWAGANPEEEAAFFGRLEAEPAGWAALTLPPDHPNTDALRRLLPVKRRKGVRTIAPDDMTDAILQAFYYCRRDLEEVAAAARRYAGDAAVAAARARATAAGQRFGKADATRVRQEVGTAVAAGGAPPPPPPPGGGGGGSGQSLAALRAKLPKKERVKAQERQAKAEARAADAAAKAERAAARAVAAGRPAPRRAETAPTLSLEARVAATAAAALAAGAEAAGAEAAGAEAAGAEAAGAEAVGAEAAPPTHALGRKRARPADAQDEADDALQPAAAKRACVVLEQHAQAPGAAHEDVDHAPPARLTGSKRGGSRDGAAGGAAKRARVVAVDAATGEVPVVAAKPKPRKRKRADAAVEDGGPPVAKRVCLSAEDGV